MALELSNLPREEQYALFQKISAPIGDVVYSDETHADDTPFESVAWNLGQLMLTTTRFPMATMIRNETHIAAGNCEYVRIRIFRGGGGTSLVDDHQIDVVPDDVHFVHGTSKVQMTVRADDILGLLIPYEVVEFDGSAPSRYFSIGGRDITARMIRAALETTLAEMPITAPGELPKLAAALIGLVRGLLVYSAEELADDQSFRLLQGHSIRSFVDQNLLDETLTAERLSEEFGASRASVYRHFAEFGGLRKYTLSRRLDRCMFDLVNAAEERGAVRRIAESWGFDETAQFSRQFRERFGVSPSETLGLQGKAHGQAGVSPEMVFPDFAFLLRDEDDAVAFLNDLTAKS
ncbi:MAG: helix-turn-helix domain-containing protein [Pseudomonadota bacterium]